ncbi:hypothetical protein PVAP13_8KG224803 [Panicum virgatum]|uniref:Uncharacterized protein n=1 Tax=Panicum virgatum TaxID=38727 RepID=A0A8T0PKH2_PANVG|nr:hypothetical protein PVAP13_8KG224803 [Panicum virgatum]
MILALQGRILQTLKGSCVHVIARARNPLAAVQERSQGKLLTFCKADPRLLHPVQLQQARVLLMTFFLNRPPRLQVEYSSEQRNYPSVPRLHRPGIVPGFTVEMERNYYKMWHLGRHSRRKSTNMKREKVLRGVFGVNSMKTSIPQC